MGILRGGHSVTRLAVGLGGQARTGASETARLEGAADLLMGGGRSDEQLGSGPVKNQKG